MASFDVMPQSPPARQPSSRPVIAMPQSASLLSVTSQNTWQGSHLPNAGITCTTSTTSTSTTTVHGLTSPPHPPHSPHSPYSPCPHCAPAPSPPHPHSPPYCSSASRAPLSPLSQSCPLGLSSPPRVWPYDDQSVISPPRRSSDTNSAEQHSDLNGTDDADDWSLDTPRALWGTSPTTPPWPSPVSEGQYTVHSVSDIKNLANPPSHATAPTRVRTSDTPVPHPAAFHPSTPPSPVSPRSCSLGRVGSSLSWGSVTSTSSSASAPSSQASSVWSSSSSSLDSLSQRHDSLLHASRSPTRIIIRLVNDGDQHQATPATAASSCPSPERLNQRFGQVDDPDTGQATNPAGTCLATVTDSMIAAAVLANLGRPGNSAASTPTMSTTQSTVPSTTAFVDKRTGSATTSRPQSVSTTTTTTPTQATFEDVMAYQPTPSACPQDKQAILRLRFKRTHIVYEKFPATSSVVRAAAAVLDTAASVAKGPKIGFLRALRGSDRSNGSQRHHPSWPEPSSPRLEPAERMQQIKRAKHVQWGDGETLPLSCVKVPVTMDTSKPSVPVPCPVPFPSCEQLPDPADPPCSPLETKLASAITEDTVHAFEDVCAHAVSAPSQSREGTTNCPKIITSSSPCVSPNSRSALAAERDDDLRPATTPSRDNVSPSQVPKYVEVFRAQPRDLVQEVVLSFDTHDCVTTLHANSHTVFARCRHRPARRASRVANSLLPCSSCFKLPADRSTSSVLLLPDKLSQSAHACPTSTK